MLGQEGEEQPHRLVIQYVVAKCLRVESLEEGGEVSGALVRKGEQRVDEVRIALGRRLLVLPDEEQLWLGVVLEGAEHRA